MASRPSRVHDARGPVSSRWRHLSVHRCPIMSLGGVNTISAIVPECVAEAGNTVSCAQSGAHNVPRILVKSCNFKQSYDHTAQAGKGSLQAKCGGVPPRCCSSCATGNLPDCLFQCCSDGPLPWVNVRSATSFATISMASGPGRRVARPRSWQHDELPGVPATKFHVQGMPIPWSNDMHERAVHPHRWLWSEHTAIL